MSKSNAEPIEVSQHYVTFVSPGTFVPETNDVAVDKWDVDEAVKLSRTIVQRYGAKPYCFYFSTEGRTAKDLNSKELKRSHFYFLGGTIETLEQIKARNDPKESSLIFNMEANGHDKILVNNNSYKSCLPIGKDDVILDYKP